MTPANRSAVAFYKYTDDLSSVVVLNIAETHRRLVETRPEPELGVVCTPAD
jgi:hypothetical protein